MLEALNWSICEFFLCIKLLIVLFNSRANIIVFTVQ